jgi:hypothetical protein
MLACAGVAATTRCTASADTYPVATAALVATLLIGTDDADLAGRILEVYFRFLENPAAHGELHRGGRFGGFPEKYGGTAASLADLRPIVGEPVGADSPERGVDPSAWLAIAALHYHALLRGRTDAGASAQKARAWALAEAIAGWLGYLQDDGLDAYLIAAGRSRATTPWLDGAVAAAVDDRTGQVVRGPSTRSSAMAYAVFRRMEATAREAGDSAGARGYARRADRLAAWFRYVVDGVGGRVLSGRTLDGAASANVSSAFAEEVDAYALLVLAGVTDADLGSALLDRVAVACASRVVADKRGRQVAGLAPAPSVAGIVAWTVHGRADMAARLVGHRSEQLLHIDLRAGAEKCLLPIFTADATIDDQATLDLGESSPALPAWLGDAGQISLEATALLAMREKLGSGDLLGPITWPAAVARGDALLGQSPTVLVSCGEMGPPSGPYGEEASLASPDHPYLSLWKSAEENDCRVVWYLDVAGADGGASVVDGGSDDGERVLLVRYLGDGGVAGVPFADRYTFFMNATPGIRRFAIELTDGAGKAATYSIPMVSVDGFRKVVLDLGAQNFDRQAVRELRLHIQGQGRIKLDGVVN